MTGASEGRTTFWPVVLVGIAASGLTALAGYRPLLQVQQEHLEQFGVAAVAQGEHVKELPLVGALALLMLACWGVVLVTRRVTRQVLGVLASVCAVGLLVVLVLEGFARRDDVVLELGAPVEHTGWFWVALVGAIVALGAAVAAVRLAAGWPEMGSRYDAPATHEREASAAPPEERTSLDLWKSMDEGDDPTDP